MKYILSYVCLTHRGNLRGTNQDNYVCNGRYNEDYTVDSCPAVSGSVSSGDGHIFGVFDGMGGEECGEIASFLAARQAAQTALSANSPEEMTRFCREANSTVFEYQRDNGIRSMGTTAALMSFAEEGITLCNVGDSRIYRLRESGLQQLSVDHTMPAPFGKKAPLYQYLGMDPAESMVEPYLVCEEYRDGDIYLICSDGLTDMVPEEDIASIIAREGIDGAHTLLAAALKGGGRDNITLLLARVKKRSAINEFLNKLLSKDTSEDKQ